MRYKMTPKYKANFIHVEDGDVIIRLVSDDYKVIEIAVPEPNIDWGPKWEGERVGLNLLCNSLHYV